MPTKLNNRNNAWLARVIIDGRQVDSRIFPPGRKKGPEWLAAKTWEEQRKKELLAEAQKRRQILSGLDLLSAWGEKYLEYARQNMGRKTLVEKTTVMRHFFAFCHEMGISSVEKIGKPALMQWLANVAAEHGRDRANRYRKNLLAAWRWGIDAIEGFPQETSPLEKIKPFAVDSQERYVPPDEDIIKVLRIAEGQDLVMLLTFYYTGARRGEIFRLTWDDVDLLNGRIRFIDHKGGSGRKRVRWLPMHPTLMRALQKWYEMRPCKVPNVFMRLDHDTAMGQPFTQRQKLMPILCARAGVRPFGFHALRHKAASITFSSGGLNAAQQLTGHSRATTTDIYIRSAGLYSDQGIITEALGDSEIGQVANELLTKIPLSQQPQGVFCKQDIVNNQIQ